MADFPTDWDDHHPADAMEALEEVGAEDDCDVPATPTIDGLPEVVDYSTPRSPGDWVISGPLEPFEGAGRVFLSEEAALLWGKRKYGDRRVQRWYGGSGRWALLVKSEQGGDGG